jgi:hypothetical protein
LLKEETMKPLGVAVAARGIDQSIIDRFTESLKQTGFRDYRLSIEEGPAVGTLNISRAKNRAIRLLLETCDSIVITDIDMLIPPGLLEKTQAIVRDGHAVWCPCRNIDDPLTDRKWNEWERLPIRETGTGSWIAMTASDWKRCGGFNETCYGYGGEDDAFCKRQHELGIHTVRIEMPLVHVNHPFRGKHWKQKRSEENLRIGTQYRANYFTDTLPSARIRRTIAIFVTADCLNHCVYCSQAAFMKAKAGYHMPMEQVELFCQCVDASDENIPEVLISGGEPILWKNLIPGLVRFKRCRKINKVGLFTSAPPYGHYEAVIKSVDRLCISRYGHNEEIARQIARISPKVDVAVHTWHYPLPQEPVEGAIPGGCLCEGPAYIDGQIWVCSCMLSLQLQHPHLSNDTCLCEPIGPNFHEILRGWKNGNEPPCALCVANPRVRIAGFKVG